MKKKKISLDELKIDSFWLNPNPEAQVGGGTWGECSVGTYAYGCVCTDYGSFPTSNNCNGGGGTGDHDFSTYGCETASCPTQYGCNQATDFAPRGACNTLVDDNGLTCTSLGYQGC